MMKLFFFSDFAPIVIKCPNIKEKCLTFLHCRQTIDSRSFCDQAKTRTFADFAETIFLPVPQSLQKLKFQYSQTIPGFNRQFLAGDFRDKKKVPRKESVVSTTD